MIDTGSVISCISSELARELKLRPVGKERVITLAGQFEGLLHVVDLGIKTHIPGLDQSELYRVLQLPCVEFQGDPGYGFLIGWDLLATAQLTIIGPSRSASICF